MKEMIEQVMQQQPCIIKRFQLIICCLRKQLSVNYDEIDAITSYF